MYSFAKECIPTKPPKPLPKDEVEEEEQPYKKECKCFLDICQEEEEQEPEPEFQYGKYCIENITVTHPPLLKIYYWECFNIDGLNSQLCGNEAEITHSFVLLPRLLHSRPLKVIFWLRNRDKPLTLKVKRVKNCECTHKETRVGFNQFRYLYHCPHRRLVFVFQEEIHMKPNDLVALTMTFFFFYSGKNVVTYQITSSDGRVVTLNVAFDVDCFFNPEKCVLTKELVPVNIESFKRFVQPIWVRNLTMCHLTFTFRSNNRGACLVNTNLTVPCQSIWPLLIEYRASDCSNEVELLMNFESITAKLKIKADGIAGNYLINYTCPILDYECADCLYIIFPNRLELLTSFNKLRTTLVCVANHSQECMEFKFQNYIISDYLAVLFEPQQFRLKAHRFKLIQVTVKTFERAMYFHRIPLIMEVHKVFDKGTRIAKELLTEVESIDDPKWAQDSYKEHCYLHMDVIIQNPRASKCLDPDCCPVPAEEMSKYTNMKNWCVPPPPATRNTIFEKLFFEYLAESDFLKERECSREYRQQTYGQLLGFPLEYRPSDKTVETDKVDPADQADKTDSTYSSCRHKKTRFGVPLAGGSTGNKNKEQSFESDKRGVYKTLTTILWQSCVELSKSWLFVPEEQIDESDQL